MSQPTGMLTFGGFGTTHPPQEEMTSLDQAFQILENNGVEITPRNRERMKAVGVHWRWFSTQTSDELAYVAAQEAVERTRRIYPDFLTQEIGLVYCGGATLGRPYPTQSVTIAHRLGVTDGAYRARDISGACASWSHGVIDASDIMIQRSISHGLVAVGEVIGSRSNEPMHPNYCLWDDQGAASMLHYNISGNPRYGIIRSESVSLYGEFAVCQGLGTDSIRPYLLDPAAPRQAEKPNALLLDGPGLYRFICEKAPLLIKQVLEASRIRPANDRVFLVPHGANMELVAQVAADPLLGFSESRVLTMLGPNGRSNMSSASCPTTLYHYGNLPNFFQKDDVIVLATFTSDVQVDIILYRLGEVDFHLAA